jgi:hypothetical protein
MMLREEQERLRREIADVDGRLRDAGATLGQWQEILDIAMRFAQSCGAAYRVANERTRTLYNRAVFETLIVRDGVIAEPEYAPPCGIVFGVDEFLSEPAASLIPPGPLESLYLRQYGVGSRLTSACDDVVTDRSSAVRRSWIARLGTTKEARKIGRKLFPVHRKATVWLSAASKV